VQCRDEQSLYLNKQGEAVKQIVFDGEPFTAASLWRMRERVLR
jgi:hypothetical protein